MSLRGCSLDRVKIRVVVLQPLGMAAAGARHPWSFRFDFRASVFIFNMLSVYTPVRSCMALGPES